MKMAYRFDSCAAHQIMKRDRTKEYEKKRHSRRAKFYFLRVVKTDKGCKICGYNKHHAALQFHHRDSSDKKFALAKSENFSWETVLKEVEKCDVLCSNCHAIVEHDKKKVNVGRKCYGGTAAS